MEKLDHDTKNQKFIYESDNRYRAGYIIDVNNPGKTIPVHIYGIYSDLNNLEKKVIIKTLRDYFSYIPAMFGKKIRIYS